MASWTLARLERAVELFSAQLQCAICLCAYDKPVSLPCNHCFCEECIHRALELKTQCPICKAPAKKRRLRDDSTVRELLRAAEMLCAAPAAAAVEQQPIRTDEETPKQVKTEVREAQVAAAQAKVAAVAAPAKAKVAATPEKRASPRRRAKQTKHSPQTQTSMDDWISGGSTSLRSQLVIKTEKTTPVRRASPRRAVARDLRSQMASPLSPALFEISAPTEKKAETSREEEADCDVVMTQVDHADEQALTPRRQKSSADEEPAEADETQLEVVEVNDQEARRQPSVDAVSGDAHETQLEEMEVDMQQTVSPRRRRSPRNIFSIDDIEGETQPEEEVLQASPPHLRRSSRNADKFSSETQLEDVQQTGTPRRRRSTTDVNTDETQVKAAELKLQTPTLRGRRRSATDAITEEFQQIQAKQQQTSERRRRNSAARATRDIGNSHLEPAQFTLQVPNLRSRLRSATDEGASNVAAVEAQGKTAEAKSTTLAPLKRRRSETNGVKETGRADSTHHSNGKVARTNGLVAKSSLAIDSQTDFPLEIETFEVGDLVEVIERQWVGINKRGGAARIITVHGDGFYGVKFLVETGMDKRVPGTFIRRPPEDIVSGSTPSSAVRKRQRRRPSDIMASPDPVSPKIRPSPRSEKDSKPKMKTKTKHSMVFLCSGFKEDRMHQIDEWAELLGAEVVQYWSNHVTHLIVKCVSAEEAREDERSMDESDLESSPRLRDGKRKLFGDPKTGRWVKIRSLKYLKALVGGRWIVSDEWLQACADNGGYVSEVNYEADGHWKGRRIHDAVKRSRQMREKLLGLSVASVDHSDIGTMLFADFCFHVMGDFLPPMPPVTELNTLICMGGGKLIPFMDDIPNEMHKCENRARKLIIVSDKLNPKALRRQTRQLKAQPQVKAVSAAIIVNYLWVINSISEAKLRELP